MAARKKTTSPTPIILTPEQVEAQARRDERNDAYLATRESLISRAHALAEKLHPGRVYSHSAGLESFSVMFGDSSAPRLSFAGPGVVEMCVELTTWSHLPDSDEFVPVSLCFLPRAYLSCSDGVDGAEAQGRALIDAARFARTLLALLA